MIRKQQEFRKEKATGGSKSALLAAKRAAHKVNVTHIHKHTNLITNTMIFIIQTNPLT